MDDKTPRETHVDQIGNAGNVYVANQTIYHNGKAIAIREVPTEALRETAERLEAAARRHDQRAAALLWLVFAGWVVILSIAAQHFHVTTASPARAWLALAVLSGIVPFVLWFGTYDLHRRHRVAMRVAEARWAEIDVELSTRPHPATTQRPSKWRFDITFVQAWSRRFLKRRRPNGTKK